MKIKIQAIVATCVVALLVVLAGCAASNNSGTPANDSASGVESSASTTSNAEVAESSAISEPKSLEEYAALYPLQTAGWTKIREDDRSMGGMDVRWHEFEKQMGGSGIPIACGSCHLSNYLTILEENGDDAAMKTDSDVEVEWMGCGVCHDADPATGVKANTVYKDYFITDFDSNIPEKDQLCGQCHMLFPGTFVTMPEYQNTMDLYKYGTSAEDTLRAYKEAYDNDPVVPTDEMKALTFDVGMTYFDEAIGTNIYGWDNETALEMYQGSNHQTLGVSCVDCHMPTTTADDGTTYTQHYACEPLADEDSLNYCLTCHESQGIDSTSAMVEFLSEKQAELGEMQSKVHADLDALYEKLTAATAEGTMDSAVLEEARTAYADAYYYYVFERGDDHGADDGAKAAHNFQGSMELLQKADDLVQDALAKLP